MSRFVTLSIDRLCNALAATSDEHRGSGSLNAWGNSFPAEELHLGETVEVGCVPFGLAPATAAGDHLEALGQVVDVVPHAAIGLAALCFGEMGPQTLDFEVMGQRASRHASITSPGWLVDRSVPTPSRALMCSHLHYPGGYELDHFRPTAWCRTAWFGETVRVSRLHLGVNPLFHILALTSIGLRDG